MLKVDKPKKYAKLKSGNGYGSQTSSQYNPQVTVPDRTIEPTLTKQQTQPTYGTGQVLGASAIQKKAVKSAVDRQRQIVRAKIQSKIKNRVSANQSAFKLKVNQIEANQKLRVGAKYAPKHIGVHQNSDEDNEYMRVKADAKNKAIELVNKTKADPSTGRFDRFVDKVTFGADRRADSARRFAEEQAVAVADRQVKVYEEKLQAHNTLQAQLQADYERKKSQLSPTQLNALAEQYNAKLQSSVNDLNHVRAYTEGTIEGYGLSAKEKLKSTSGKVAGWINRNVIQKAQENPAWKYTLGEGSENIPSVQTAPSRIINWFGNINTKDRNIYKYGGESMNRVGSGKNAWQATFNQRNKNTRPWVDIKPGAQADQILGQETRNLIEARKKIGVTDPDKLDYDKVMEKKLLAYNKSNRYRNSAEEVASDPWNLLAGAGALLKTAKGGKYASKFTKTTRANRGTAWAFKTADKVSEAKSMVRSAFAENTVVKKLFSEAKTSGEHLSDAVQVAKNIQKTEQDAILGRINAINKKLTQGEKLDISIFDDLKTLTDSEAKMLQRITNGKLNARDRLRLSGKNYAPIREKLETIAKKWDEFAEQMKLADDVKSTRFGKGKKLYSPRTAWVKKDLKEYNFRAYKKHLVDQPADDFRQGAVDRYFKSNIDEIHATKQTSKANRLKLERDELLKRYDESLEVQRKNVTKAYKKTRSPGARLRSAVGAPTRLWKKSVLKYRPAWTVNNVLYNTQAGVLASGPGSLVEQAKMLNPRYYRKAMDESKKYFGSNLGKEIGDAGRLNKFYSGVEDWSRVAAGRVAMKKYGNVEKAQKRVNKYLFDYKTTNIERPLKAVVPFWAWQKNLTKAGATMPYDRPLGAIAYNRLDKNLQADFDKQFEAVVPKLTEMGYSEDEIQAMKEDQAKYFAKRLRVGNKYYTTPFNAFSEQGLSSTGFNPYLSAVGETAEGVDSYGRKIMGNEASIIRRLTTKFPQAELGYKKYKSYRVDKGLDKPSKKYIGESGSEGYGLTKERQGYDSSKPNYDSNMDPRTKNKQDLSAFLGKPRSLEFNKEKYLESKNLQKVTTEYFKKSGEWKDMDYDKSQAEQKKLFKKYGITADEFYKGILAKYDSDFTKKVKAKKEEASAKNKKLFEEYARQPKGTRNMWATKKLAELNDEGYFDDNPFLKSFKWINKDSYTKAGKQRLVQQALKTGDWSAYRKAYGVKSSPHQYKGKYFKSSESMAKYKRGEFWRKYADADPEARRDLLDKNPEYNDRKDWTKKQWDDWKAEQRKKHIAGLNKKDGGKKLGKYQKQNQRKADEFNATRIYRRKYKRLAYS